VETRGSLLIAGVKMQNEANVNLGHLTQVAQSHEGTKVNTKEKKVVLCPCSALQRLLKNYKTNPPIHFLV
jgi:hypothetical protein